MTPNGKPHEFVKKVSHLLIANMISFIIISEFSKKIHQWNLWHLMKQIGILEMTILHFYISGEAIIEHTNDKCCKQEEDILEDSNAKCHVCTL